MCGIAWYWLWRTAAGTMSASSFGPMAMADMTAPAMRAEIWHLAYLGPAFAMWAIMMVAMMLPSATPVILLYGALSRRGAGLSRLATFIFALAYLLVWIAFAVLATIAQA